MCEAIEGIREDARVEGMKIGRTEGIEIGRTEERSRNEEKLLRIEENLRKSGMPEEQIKQILNS